MKSPINRRNGPVQLEELCNLNIHIKARPSTVSPRTSDTKILWHRNGALSGAITLVPRRMARLPDIITIGRLATIYVYDADANQLEGCLRAALRLERGQDSLRAAA